jgi:hypothetical protein
MLITMNPLMHILKLTISQGKIACEKAEYRRKMLKVHIIIPKITYKKHRF